MGQTKRGSRRPAAPSARAVAVLTVPRPSARFARETVSARALRAQQIDRLLAATFPDAHCELDHRDAWQLLVATVLSAQSTDVQVNTVTPALFERFAGPGALAAASPEDVEPLIRRAGMSRQKSRTLVRLAAQVLDQFAGAVPATMEELITLPGVGRKTANVVLGNAFSIPGLPVDTHVTRVSGRLGLTKSTDPAVIEAELTAMLPPAEWTMASHRLIFQGRYVCHARRPACRECTITALCAAAELTVPGGPTRP
jgi:endonuclease-3